MAQSNCSLTSILDAFSTDDMPAAGEPEFCGAMRCSSAVIRRAFLALLFAMVWRVFFVLACLINAAHRGIAIAATEYDVVRLYVGHALRTWTKWSLHFVDHGTINDARCCG